MWNWRKKRDADDLEQELHFHLEELRSEGGDDFARRKLGNATAIREAVHETHSVAALETIVRNVRFALRTFRKHMGAYGFAIGVLAAGIGISTAIFSLVKAVLLTPLPFSNQGRIEVIQKADPRAGPGVVELAFPELADLQDNVEAFSAVALMPTTLYGYGKVIQNEGRSPVQVESTPVSHDFFQVLGVSPVIGRDFRATDESAGAAPVTILSDATWRREFGADPGVIGRLIRVNGDGYHVIGVLGPGVEFPRGAGMWVPLGVSPEMEQRGATYLQAIARRRPGYSHQQAVTEVAATFARTKQQFPRFYSPSQQAVVTPLPQYWAGSSRVQLWISLMAALSLLITAAFTASNLFVSRAFARTQEIATRFSVGASAVQIWGQFATEALVAALLAAVGGWGLASILVRFLVRLAPEDIPRIEMTTLDLPVLVFALVVASLTALICTIGPAAMVSTHNVESVLRSGGLRLTAGRATRRMQNFFTAGQIAVTLPLLCASLLIVLSVRALLLTDVGFANRDAVTMNVALASGHYDREHRDRFYTSLLGKLRATAGISDAGAALLRPFEGSIGWDMKYRAVFNLHQRPEDLQLSNFEVVTPDYFAALGVPLMEGRDFDSRDIREGQQVAIISHNLAERFRKAGTEPIGQKLQLGSSLGGDWMTIVGVVKDTRDRNVATAGADIYVPYLQAEIPVRYLVIRGTLPEREVVALVQREVAALDRAQPVASVATLRELIDRDLARQRFNMVLLVTFGSGALLLAAAGVFSVVAETVSARKQEIGIRIALGAGQRALWQYLVVQTMTWVAAGEAAGLMLVLVAGHMVSGWLYGVHPQNPAVLIGVTLFLLGASVTAGSIPAWVQTRMAPSESLRIG